MTPLRQTKLVSRASPRTKEMAYFMSSHVDQYSAFMKFAAAQSGDDGVSNASDECKSFCGNKRSVSALLEAAHFVNEDVESIPSKRLRSDGCDEDEPSAYYTRIFAKAHDAKNACISSETAIGVGQEVRNDHLVFHVFYQTQDHLKISEIETDWLYMKARSNHDGERHLVKLKNAPCRTYKRGVVRRSYALDNSMHLKIYHYSCKALEFPTPCRNCKHDKWNSRCLSGNEKIVLSFK